jgi:methanogenic corrinoid protein MtbC1
MYEIGMLWERAEISVAEEHLASAIVVRIMATIGIAKIEVVEAKGRAVVTASPNEFHEIGAWMVSDALEQDGWMVQYLGANTPREDLVRLLQSFNPDILAISVTIPFNVNKAKDTITSVRSKSELAGMKIMVGGRVFNENPELWAVTGADGFAPNLQSARRLAAQWKEDAN